MGNSEKNSLYYYWKVTNSLAGYFTRIFPNSLHYIWTFTPHFVGVFLKKFRKFSHKMVSRFSIALNLC